MSPYHSELPSACWCSGSGGVAGEGDPTEDAALSAVALAALNIVGAVLRCSGRPPACGSRTERPIVALVAFCAVAASLIAGRRPKPSWTLQTAIASTRRGQPRVVASRDPGGVYAFDYVWVGLYAVWLRVRESRSMGRGSGSPWPVRCPARPPARRAAYPVAVAGGDAAGHGSAGASSDEPACAWARSGCGTRPATTRSPGWRTAGCSTPPQTALGGDGEGDLRAVAFVDLDHFKTGQRQPRARRSAMSCWSRSPSGCARTAGPIGLLARFGGDEFVALLHGPEWETVAPSCCARSTTVQRRRLRAGRDASSASPRRVPGTSTNTRGPRRHGDIPAKRSGRAQLATFEGPPRARRAGRARLERDLRRRAGRDAMGSPTSRSRPRGRTRSPASRPSRAGPIPRSGRSPRRCSWPSPRRAV